MAFMLFSTSNLYPIQSYIYVFYTRKPQKQHKYLKNQQFFIEKIRIRKVSSRFLSRIRMSKPKSHGRFGVAQYPVPDRFRIRRAFHSSEYLLIHTEIQPYRYVRKSFRPGSNADFERIAILR